MAQKGTRNVNQTLPYLGNMAQARSRKIRRGTWMEALIHALEKRLREREREDRSRGAKPLGLMIIALYGLGSSCLHPCPFCSLLGARTPAPSILAPCLYMQRQKKHTNRQAKKQMKGKAC